MSDAGPRPRSPRNGAAADPLSGPAAMAAWPPLRTAFGATVALVGVTCLAIGVAVPEPLSRPGVPRADGALPAGPATVVGLVVVVFGGPVATLVGGALGAGMRGGAGDAEGARAPDRRSGRLRAIATLAGLLLLGVAATTATGLATLAAGSWVGGGRGAGVSTDGTLGDAPDAVLAAILGAWAAGLALVALGLAAGALTGRPVAGLALLGGLVAAELLVTTVEPGSPLLAAAPLAGLGDLARTGSAGAAAPALGLVAAMAALLATLAVVTAGSRPADHPQG